MRLRWVAGLLLVLGVLAPKPASAELFKCTDAAGTVTFSDMPCPTGTRDASPPPLDTTPKSLGVDCWYRKVETACSALRADGRPEVLAQAREDYRYALDRERCLNGDYAGCKRSVCKKAFSLSPSASDILDCSREQRLPNGATWAIVMPWQDLAGGGRKAQGFCLSPSVEVVKGQRQLKYMVVNFREDAERPMRTSMTRHSYRYKNSRYSASGTSAARGETLDEAASEVCR